MSLSFYPPSYRASQSDLTISISPLGLVEMADEEFEVHGVRLSRYSLYWSHYLGHMYAYRREVGEPQFAVNYVKALSDYITNFTFGKGISFRTPPATSAIVPPLLKRVWEQDNRKESVLWEMGQTSGVTGDCFVKIAYEEAFVDSIGRLHPGRVRILPMNPAHCFPQWHEHDRQRMLSFKLKYRFWTTAPDGTRQVMTYVEKISETGIEEYVNDELIDSRPNPLGVIPVVYIPNNPVSGSPWGTPDIADVVALNREYNEKALEISDIINYHSAPVTVVIGAKSSQLEKGPRKTWTLPKDASVENLQALVNLDGPLAFMETIKRAMHEMTGVPEQALGQMQPISNTSGVALQIQYQPLMNRYNMKKLHFSSGFQRINELILLTLFQKEPWVMQFDPREGTVPDEGALLVLDPNDPNTYETSVHWPPPLPVDVLVKINEIMAKMNLGLESKRGALRELGEEFPEEKMAEVFAELLEDQKESAALQLREAATTMATWLLTGMPPSGEPDAQGTANNGDGSSVVSAGDGEGSMGQPIGEIPPEVADLAQDLVTRAYGTKFAQYRNPANN